MSHKCKHFLILGAIGNVRQAFRESCNIIAHVDDREKSGLVTTSKDEPLGIDEKSLSGRLSTPTIAGCESLCVHLGRLLL